MVGLKEQEKRLFDKWQTIPGLKRFCKDGVVDHEEWESTNQKVIFLLKETNGSLISLPNFLTNLSDENIKNFGSTWFNIARWSYGIQHIHEEINWPVLNGFSNKTLAENLKYICAINIKKTPGKGTTNHSELSKAVSDYGNRTIEQIQLYKSNFLVLCGTANYFNILYSKYINPEEIKWYETSRGIWYSKQNNGMNVIWYFHPGSHFPKQFLYYNLLDAIKEIKNT